MSRFSINPDALENISDRFYDISADMMNLMHQIEDVKEELDIEYRKYYGVASALGTCAINANRLHSAIWQYGSKAAVIADKYKDAEASITGNVQFDKFGNMCPVNGMIGVAGGLAGRQYRYTELGYERRKKWDNKKKAEYKKDFVDGKWVDAEEKKQEKGLELDVKLMTWETEEMPSGSLLGDTGKGEKGIEGEYGSASVSYDALSYDTYADAYVGLLSAGGHMGASFTALSADAEGELGNDMLGVYANANVTVGRAEAELGASAGVFDKYGNFNPSLKAEASAEVIAVEASASGGAKILGTDISATGKLQVGLGAHANIGFENGKLSLDLGAQIGVGASIKLDIDVSGTVNAVKGAAESALKGMKSFFGW